jgi:hypothetical protein
LLFDYLPSVGVFGIFCQQPTDGFLFHHYRFTPFLKILPYFRSDKTQNSASTKSRLCIRRKSAISANLATRSAQDR